MVRCPRCGALMATDRAQVKSDKSSSSEGPANEADSAKQSRGQKGEGCARCGRAFRGPWDTYETKIGKLCNFCVNLAEVRDALQGPAPKANVNAANVRPEMTPNLGDLDTAQDAFDGAMDDHDEEPDHDHDEDASNGSPEAEPSQQAPAEYRVPRTQVDAQRKQWLAAIMGVALIVVTLFVLLAEGC